MSTAPSSFIWSEVQEEENETILIGKPTIIGDNSHLYDSSSDSSYDSLSTSSEDNEEEEEEEFLEDDISPYDQASLPSYSCKYCGIHEPNSICKCLGCNKWFCNGKGIGNSGSHIIQHLVRSRHREVMLHPESPLGDSTLECYHCGNKNIFQLGYIPAKADSVVVLLCRQPCAMGSSAKDATWDLDSWTPLIKEKGLLTWLLQQPSSKAMKRARDVNPVQIVKIEELWKSNPDATFDDLHMLTLVEEQVERVLLRYENATQFRNIMLPLVNLEAEQDKMMVENQKSDNLTVRWDIGLNMKRCCWFFLPNASESGFRISPGDEVTISNPSLSWNGIGNITHNSGNSSEEICVELFSGARNCPTSYSQGYSVIFNWKCVSYMRMKTALNAIVNNELCIEPAVLHHLLGNEIEGPSLSFTLPTKISAPGLPELNFSQIQAVESVLKKPLSLIQGPPGTGKTVTSATIVYLLARRNVGPILVCASSNVAVDHLTEKIHQTGLNVVRILSKVREEISSSVSFLSLANQVKVNSGNLELERLFKLRSELGELSVKDEDRFNHLSRKVENIILSKAQVICTTAIGAGSPKLKGMKFSAVLFDEATQATEPEAIVPLIHGIKQVIMVGDHKQLGPVVLCKKAANAGFNRSLFERLIDCGERPHRLQVQYRMHPCLSEFPSTSFYDGSLQNGITSEDRLRLNMDFPWPDKENPMFFLSCIGSEEISSSGTSFLNRIEANSCEKIVTRLLKGMVLPDQIGVITPYDGQRAYIQSHMQMAGPLKKELYKEVEIASVDAFQGREKDYIILSCVRSNDGQGIGFLSDERRLNVALTRAKYGLIILGNPKLLSKNSLWNNLLTHFKERQLLVEGTLNNLRPSLMQLSRPRNPAAQSMSFLKKITSPQQLPQSSTYISEEGTSLSEFESLNISGLLNKVSLDSKFTYRN